MPSVNRPTPAEQTLSENLRGGTSGRRAIRSILLNVIVILAGLVFLAAGLGYLLEDVSWAGIWGVLHAHALIFGALNSAMAYWCIRGGFSNLRARKDTPTRQLGPPERASIAVAIALMGSLCVLVWGNFQADALRAHGGIPAAFYIAVVIFILSILAVPAIAIWASRR